MTAIATRSSVLALKVETVEGTPVAPANALDYIALQDDADFSPEFEQLENAELKNSLGSAKGIVGSENPTASFSHYLRHSGVEGTAPGYNDLLKAAFGTETVYGVQYDTVAGSTTTALNVDVGEGANFARGQALLVKDGTNGYRIRPVHSITGDALTLGFALPTAPGTGVNLGKSVTYSPANSGHQTLTAWHYLGNGGAVEMVSGCRVTEVSASFEAGQLINASYSLEGIEFYFNPVIILAADTKLDFTDDDGTFVATVTAKVYKDPHDLADAIQTAMNTANPGETHTATYSDSTGKYTIKSTGTVLSLLWNTGANTANTIGDKIGFSTAADDTGVAAATGYTSDTAFNLAAPQTPTYDTADPLAAKDNQVLVGDGTETVCFDASSVSFTLSDTRRVIESVCAVSGRSGSIINAREATVTVSALLNQYDADKFRRLRSNTDTRFMYAFGTKAGGNYVAGKCGLLYLPTATVSSLDISDDDGLASVEFEVKAFVDSSGNGEVYLSFV